MAVWIDAGPEEAFTDGQIHALDHDGESVAIVRLGPSVYAVENACTHEEQPLDEGTVEGDELVCPLHGARFCLRTGEVTAPPACEGLRTYAVRLRGGRVEVAFASD